MILVVDDDKTLVQLVRELLEKTGYEVRSAFDGAEAYRHVKDPKCKGVILDFHMPHLNGPELLMLMASDAIELPVIVMTGNHDFDETEMKQFSNVKKLLFKPLYPEELLAAVQKHFKQPQPAA